MQPEIHISAHATVGDIGAMANNGIFVRMLQSALSQSEKNLTSIPGLIEDVINDGSWLCWCTGEGQVYQWSPAEFRRFLEAPRPSGCQTPIPLIRKILQGTDALPRFEEMIRGEPGGANNPSGTNQHTKQEVNCDNIIVDQPRTIPFPSAKTPPPTGTSTSYALRRLSREAPEMLDRVHKGEITPNRAMVEAGLRKPQLQAPDDPEALANYLLRKWDRERIAALLAKLAEALTS